MCLITTYKTPKIAKRDIVCYKVCRDTKADDILLTPYQFAEMMLGEINIDTKDVFITPSHKSGHFNITSGVFHSFKKLKDAKTELSDWEKHYETSCCIVRCIIPKGSEYFEGIFTQCLNDYESYGSKQIKLIEKIK